MSESPPPPPAATPPDPQTKPKDPNSPIPDPNDPGFLDPPITPGIDDVAKADPRKE